MNSCKKKLIISNTAVLWMLAIVCSYSGYAQQDSIDLFIKKEMQRKNIPGLQLAIVRNGKIVKLGSYGLANVQDSVPVNENASGIEEQWMLQIFSPG